MAKGGLLKFLVPAALGIGALATGGFGLPALLGDVAGAGLAGGAGEAALGVGEAATAGADVGAAAAGDLTAGALGDVGAGATDFSGGILGAGNAFGLPAGASVAEAGVAPDLAGLTAGGAGPITAAQAVTQGLAGPIASTGEFVAQGGEPFVGLSSLAPAPGTTVESVPGVTGGIGATAGPPPTAVGQSLPSAVAAADPTGGGGFAGTGQPADVVAATSPDPNLALAAYQAGGGAPSGGIFGTGVTGGDIFKDVGGLRGITSLLSLGLLAPQVFKGPQQYPEQKTLAQEGAGFATTANALQQPLFTGALPGGAQSAIDLAAAADKARVASTYASLGIGGTKGGPMSTMEAEALNQVDQETAARKFAIEDQLFQQALGYSTQASNVTKQLLDTSIAEDKDYRDALANFTKALAYAGGGGRTSPTYTLTPTA